MEYVIIIIALICFMAYREKLHAEQIKDLELKLITNSAQEYLLAKDALKTEVAPTETEKEEEDLVDISDIDDEEFDRAVLKRNE